MKKNSSYTPAIISFVICVVVILGGYVGGYFVCNDPYHDPAHPGCRIFDFEWERKMYTPMLALEGWLTGKPVCSGSKYP
jgi:hypothetical protein